VKPFVASEPLRIPTSEGGGTGDYSRADLIFYGVDHSGSSYEGRVFLNNADADTETPREVKDGYAGSFMVFGHDGCIGDEGHCDTEDREVDEFDFRAPHALMPWTKVVEITEAFRHVEGEGEFIITVVPVVPGERGAQLTDALRFEHVRLALYVD
jgi:hypothetical protein